MAERLKDMFFTEASLNAMADAVKNAYARFDRETFIELVFDDAFNGMELKQMMRHTTECLHQMLPKSYGRAVKVLTKAAPKVGGFEAMCLPDYVELYGLGDWDVSLEALALFNHHAGPPLSPWRRRCVVNVVHTELGQHFGAVRHCHLDHRACLLGKQKRPQVVPFQNR